MQLSPRLLQEVRLGQRVHRERDRKLTFSGGHEFYWERSDKGFPAAAAQPAAATAVPTAFGCPEASEFHLGVIHLKDP